VKVQYREGVATHSGPESCVVASEGRGEALTGESVSRVLSREIRIPRSPQGSAAVRGATAVRWSERQHRQHRNREVLPDPGRSETPSARRSFSRGNREIPCLAASDDTAVRAVNPEGARRR